jgi:hypothetical protein
VFNPIVLHHRFWDITRIFRSVLIHSAQLAIGIGLIASRKWAAVAVSLVAIYVAAAIPSEYSVALRLWVLIPALLTLAFWGSLDRASARRETLWIALAISVSGLVEYVAFLRR